MSPCHHVSQSFALSTCVTKPVSHLPCPLPLCHRVTASPRHCITMPPHHHISQSFALPPATKPVSHLPCPLPLHHCVTASPHHRATVSPHVSHLPCSLPPNQSVICLAPCHHTSQSFALPPTTASPHYCITTPPHHRITASLPQIFPTTWV